MVFSRAAVPLVLGLMTIGFITATTNTNSQPALSGQDHLASTVGISPHTANQARAAVPVAPPPQPRQPVNVGKPLSEVLTTPIDKSKVSIHIIKSAFRLTLSYDGREVKDYRVVFGQDPVTDKRSKGDKRTPEGVFSIRAQYPHAVWSRFLWLSYPTAESWQKHNDAKAKHEISPGAAIGGEIGIHGVPAGKDAWVDTAVNWTAGCISLKTADINEIYGVTQAGTSVIIDH